MEQSELNEKLKLHKLWLNGEPGGIQADMRRADMRGANMRYADMRWANMQEADMRRADMRGANMRYADMRWANMQEADMRGADLDFSCWPLWCGSKGVKIDRRLHLQLLAHLCAVDVDDDECKAHQQASLDLAKQAHIASDLGLD